MSNLLPVWVGSYHVEAGTSQMRGVALGGYVYCFIKAASSELAAEGMRAALSEDGYVIAEEEFVRRFGETEFEGEQGVFDRLAEQVLRVGGVAYSKFYTYSQGVRRN